MAKYQCSICQYIYDEEIENKRWDELSDSWYCPFCSADKSLFEKLETKNQSDSSE